MNHSRLSPRTPLLDATAKDFTRSYDVDIHARLMSSINLDQSYQQLYGGPFEGVMHTVQVGQVTIFRETLNQSTFQTGCADTEHLTFASACQLSKPAYWNGTHINEASVIAFTPGREFELRSSDISTCIGISLPIKLLATLDPHRPRDYWVNTFASMDCWTETGGSSGLSVKLAGYLDESNRSKSDVLANLAFSDTVESVLDFMSEVLAKRQPIDATLRIESYPRIARQARALMIEKIGEPLSISDICGTLGCSRRALQYAFENVYDVNPVIYLRNLRLAHVHRLLLSQPDTSVQDCAEIVGFHHLPRFAQYYSSMFGELPSITLGRQKQNRSAGILRSTV